MKDLSAGEKVICQLQTCQTRSQPPARQSREQSCHQCGGSHDAAKCRFRQVECHFCHKNGHIASICHQKAKRQSQSTQSRPGMRPTHTVTEQETTAPVEYPMYKCHSPNSKPLSVQLMTHDVPVCMEVDTGATLSIMSQNTFKSTWPNQSAPTIQPTSTQLRTYTGEQIKEIGTIDVDVQYQTQ